VLALDTYKSDELNALQSVTFVQANVTDIASMQVSVFVDAC